MRKILITGGKGYIARNLVPLFERGGYDVVAPSRTELDLLNLDMTEAIFRASKPDVIIHAATRGGRKARMDTWDDTFVPNMQMWENLNQAVARAQIHPIIITFGSGAEFDRRFPIHQLVESTVFTQWPMDPYGLSKNLITRQAVEEENTYVLRLFGCFNYDDDPSRYIVNGIQNLKRGLAVTVHQNKEMDYFYLDDIYRVIDHIIQVGKCPRHMNLVYKNKVTLLDIASLIHKHVNSYDTVINLVETGMGKSYSGCGYLLSNMPVELIGLEEGIRRTALKLI